ncbi:MAG TPA: M15 family metallopeptidase [Candidatus Gracilibacteria bacterium]|nr:M15 family metallopeptidase [Candidatus Gracilibacteria bacterium]
MNGKVIKIVDNGELLVNFPSDFLCIPMYFKNGLTSDNSMQLREGAIEALVRAKKHLPNGWNFLVWDGYRPLKLQQKLYDDLTALRQSEHPEWDNIRLANEVEKFVKYASHDPELPSPHNTGGAVDLTILNASGAELDMGTVFDEFTEKSYTWKDGGTFDDLEYDIARGITPTQSENRKILREILMAEGFGPYQWEWWHFNFGNIGWAEHYGKDVAIYGSLEL